jgi:hypothetical protein
MTWILGALKTRLGQAVSAVLALLAALGVAWAKGRSEARKKAKTEALENEVEAHDRINRADTGADLGDDERLERLRRLGHGDWNGD